MPPVATQAFACLYRKQAMPCILDMQAKGCAHDWNLPLHIVRAPQQLGPLLRAMHKQAGLTQADVAGQLGVTRQAVSELENRPESATFERLLKLCAVLGVEIVLQPRTTSRPSHTPEW